MLIVVALGGNAVSPPGQEGTIPQQFATTRAAMRPLANLLLADHQLVITHGNGPQIGNVMRRVEVAARQQIYPIPLDIAVADTQAGMGYMIAQCLMNELASRGQPRTCATVITSVRVNYDDPAFSNPAKPVGPFMTGEQAQRHAEADGWNVIEDSGRGWRRVVPSPVPREIIELDVIKGLAKTGQAIIACGGGGIPVRCDERGTLVGVEAVIDKDRTSAILALGLGADVFTMLTGVDQVQIDFGKPHAKALNRISANEALQLLVGGQFPPGSMGPKIEAAVDFLKHSTNASPQVIITSCEQIEPALAGKAGTRIIRD